MLKLLEVTLKVDSGINLLVDNKEVGALKVHSIPVECGNVVTISSLKKEPNLKLSIISTLEVTLPQKNMLLLDILLKPKLEDKHPHEKYVIQYLI